jgi:hypothetical protein
MMKISMWKTGENENKIIVSHKIKRGGVKKLTQTQFSLWAQTPMYEMQTWLMRISPMMSI